MGAWEQYQLICEEFAGLTAWRHESSGMCCERVVDGVPECCAQILSGAELTFTPAEAGLLSRNGPFGKDAFRPRADGMMILARGSFWSTQSIRDSLHYGGLARTLESVSHPTRPIVDWDGMKVLGVVLIDGCNTAVGEMAYRREKKRLMDLWQGAVDVTGLKPYYAVPDRLKTDWIVL